MMCFGEALICFKQVRSGRRKIRGYQDKPDFEQVHAFGLVEGASKKNDIENNKGLLLQASIWRFVLAALLHAIQGHSHHPQV